jgi:rhodanese-related sulfurtransferase
VALPAIRYDRFTLDELVEAARRRIARLTPVEAWQAAGKRSLIVDIRSDEARERGGVVPGSVHVPRTVLEWRLAPDSAWRNPHVGGLDSEVILMCDQGYSSVLAAATLVELGFRRAADVIGGFEGWCAAGLPVVPAGRQRPPGELPGLAPPD